MTRYRDTQEEEHGVFLLHDSRCRLRGRTADRLPASPVQRIAAIGGEPYFVLLTTPIITSPTTLRLATLSLSMVSSVL